MQWAHDDFCGDKLMTFLTLNQGSNLPIFTLIGQKYGKVIQKLFPIKCILTNIGSLLWFAFAQMLGCLEFLMFATCGPNQANLSKQTDEI